MAFLEFIAEGVAQGMVVPFSKGYRDVTDGLGDGIDNAFDWAGSGLAGAEWLGGAGDAMGKNLDLAGSLFEATIDGLSLGPAIGQQAVVEGLNTIAGVGAAIGHLQYETPGQIVQALSDGDWSGALAAGQNALAGAGEAFAKPFADSPDAWGQIFGHVLDNDLLGNQEGHNSPLTSMFEGSRGDYYILDDTNNDDIVDWDHIGGDLKALGDRAYEAWKAMHQNPFAANLGGGIAGGLGGVVGGGIAGGLGGVVGGGIVGGLAGGLVGGGSAGPVEQGMNRAQAEQILGELREARGHLVELLQSADVSVASLGSAWEGSDSRRFRQDWQSARGAAHEAVQGVEALAKALQQQISQQQGTSSA